MKKINFVFCFIGVMILLISCSKMDDYRQLINGKEITYAGKADTIRTYPGHNRIQISWLLTTDPKINKTVIYWGNRSDSVVIPIERKPGIDSINYILDNLTEGSYSFELVNYDELGNKSVPSFKTGRVYGDRYIDNLLDRGLVNIEAKEPAEVILKWSESESTTVRVEIQYQKIGGSSQTLELKNGISQISLINYLRGTKFKYRTLFLPDSLAIDTFYTKYKEITPVFEKLLNKSLFKDVTFPGDATIITSEWNISKKNLWNGSFSTSFSNNYGNYLNFTTYDARTTPLHITIDLGVTEKLKRFRANHYHTFLDKSPRKYEIWGAEQPAPDGSWDGWTKLGSVEQVKPSGLPNGQYSDADKAVWEVGDHVSFSQDLPKVRYIRIKCLENWKGNGNISLAEVTFWAYDL